VEADEGESEGLAMPVKSASDQLVHAESDMAGEMEDTPSDDEEQQQQHELDGVTAEEHEDEEEEEIDHVEDTAEVRFVMC